MSIDLAALLDPAQAALVTQECQTGVIGAESVLPELGEAARVEMVPNLARLAAAARKVGAPVVHCIAVSRADRRGGNTNARLFGAMRKRDPVASDVIPEIGLEESDIVLSRMHGIGPMADSGLDALLRNLGVRTVVAVGVSVNVGMTNFVMDAVNLGYQVVLPRDAVAGVPKEYADAVIENTLSLLATVVRTDDVLAVWSG